MTDSRSFIAGLLLAASLGAARAEPCPAEDFETHVTGDSQCLLMRRFGTSEPKTMIVWLHGDVSSGGPATYHFAIAKKAAETFAAESVLSVALVRPGYPDGSGESSTGDGRRFDHYTTANVGAVGGAIERLRAKYKPASVIVVGHSGGAATTAILLGMKPQLIDAAVLVSCPCDIAAWRAGRKDGWNRSESPIRWVDKVAPSAHVIALTGGADTNTSMRLAQAYVEALRARGIDARFQEVPGASHDGAFRAPEVGDALAGLLRKP